MSEKKIAREFIPRRDPAEVHNERLAHEKRMRKKERERAKEPVTVGDGLVRIGEYLRELRKHHPSTLSNFPAVHDRKGVELRMKGHSSLEIRLCIVDEPETEDEGQ